ncbi:hypothetical protein QWZ13_04050 [Reinekea marina]|nr:hypothetical protein [Reinekea marina]MDN3648075.1 hypothetical protein [Reinekea marina]
MVFSGSFGLRVVKDKLPVFSFKLQVRSKHFNNRVFALLRTLLLKLGGKN